MVGHLLQKYVQHGKEFVSLCNNVLRIHFIFLGNIDGLFIPGRFDKAIGKMPPLTTPVSQCGLHVVHCKLHTNKHQSKIIMWKSDGFFA